MRYDIVDMSLLSLKRKAEGRKLDLSSVKKLTIHHSPFTTHRSPLK